MATDESFSALNQIIVQGLAYPEGGAKNSRIKAVMDGLFDSRYHAKSRPKDAFRDAYSLKDEGVPYAGVIAPENPNSGAYGGASIAWFPCDDGPLMTLVVGTKGLAPDEGLLTRHGHRRRVFALRNYLAQRGVASWSKADPAAISTKMPEAARRRFPSCAAVFDRYGEVIYSAAWIPRGDAAKADTVVRAYFDLYARERNWTMRASVQQGFDDFFEALHDHLFPTVTAASVNDLLQERRFVILQGPPGTGKTRMADQVRREFFGSHGRTVQFHPAVTYEDFVVGLSPDPTDAGLRFRAKPGWLLQAATDARDNPYVLIVDEINRGDLGKVLGEAIYLFEPGEVGGAQAREVNLTLAASDAIEQLLTAQIQLRNNRRLHAAMRSSRLPAVKQLRDFESTFQPSLRREQIESLYELGFVERRENVIFLGPPGVGKTHLAISLAIAAAQSGRRVYYGTLADLITSLEEAQAAGLLQSRGDKAVDVRGCQTFRGQWVLITAYPTDAIKEAVPEGPASPAREDLRSTQR